MIAAEWDWRGRGLSFSLSHGGSVPSRSSNCNGSESVEIDPSLLEALVAAFVDDGPERTYYYDRDTSRMVSVAEDHEDPSTQEIVWQLESDIRGRFVPVPKPRLEGHAERAGTRSSSPSRKETCGGGWKPCSKTIRTGASWRGWSIGTAMCGPPGGIFARRAPRVQASEFLDQLA